MPDLQKYGQATAKTCGGCCLGLVLIGGIVAVFAYNTGVGLIVALVGLPVAGVLGYRWYRNQQVQAKAKAEADRAAAEMQRQRSAFEQERGTGSMGIQGDQFSRPVMTGRANMRCPYCNTLYDGAEGKCPNCGATSN